MSKLNVNEFPYPNIADIKFRNNEPMSYSYFNTHTVKLLQNIRSLKRTNTPQKATETQWGVTRLATVNDIISDDGDKSVAFTNATFEDAVRKLKSDNLLNYQTSGKLPLSKNYEWTHGEFVVGLNEHVAKKITNNPDHVVYSHISFIPLGFDGEIMYTARSTKTDAESYKWFEKTSDRINFGDWYKPTDYNEFHVYYHKSGYVICSNEQIDPGQLQIRVCWDLLNKK